MYPQAIKTIFRYFKYKIFKPKYYHFPDCNEKYRDQTEPTRTVEHFP